MSEPWFHVPAFAAGELDLPPEEAGHAAGAKRLRAGEAITLFDGRGNIGTGVLTAVSSRQVTARIDRTDTVAAPPALAVAVAVPKGKRLQVMIEKLTELGVTEIQPLRFARSVAEGGADPVHKWGRWTVEAAKQCRRAWLPQLHPLRDFSAFAGELPQSPARTVFLADAEGEPPVPLLRGAENPLCLIGPEGGLSPEEFALCADAGWRRLRLAAHVLRIETAACAFCAACFCAR